MAAVRRRRYRRKPVFRRRNRFRRRVARRRRSVRRGFRVKLTETQLVSGSVTKNELKELHVDLTNFSEFKRLGSNFEYCVPRVVVQTIYPQQNVSNTSTSAVPPYVIFPYHKNIPTSGVGFSDYLSIDKAKLYRGTAVGRMSFVPSIGLLNNFEINGPVTNKYFRTDMFRPKLRCQEVDIGSSRLPRLYCGGVCFSGNAELTEGSKSYFMIKTDVYLTFYNQNVLQPNTE